MRAFRLPVAMSLAFALFAMLLPADAQPATKVPRVGLLRLEALFLFADPFTVTYQKRIFDLATKRRLATTCASLESTDCLLIYGTSRLEMFRLAATYVDKILKGAKPADLPVEQATKFELIVNARTAKTLGIVIPRSILGRADRVIQ